MQDNEKYKNLSISLQENLRIDGRKKPAKYLDINNNLGSVLAGSNHVIFGRRGTGKSALIAEAFRSKGKSHVMIKIDCENLKDHSFPNVILEMLEKVFKSLNDDLAFLDLLKNIRVWNETRVLIKKLRTMKDDADEQDSEEVNEKKNSAGIEQSGVGVKTESKSTVKQVRKIKKLEDIHKNIPD